MQSGRDFRRTAIPLATFSTGGSRHHVGIHFIPNPRALQPIGHLADQSAFCDKRICEDQHLPVRKCRQTLQGALAEVNICAHRKFFHHVFFPVSVSLSGKSCRRAIPQHFRISPRQYSATQARAALSAARRSVSGARRQAPRGLRPHIAAGSRSRTLRAYLKSLYHIPGGNSIGIRKFLTFFSHDVILKLLKYCEVSMKIGFVSLGCPKNQLDTEVMLHEVVEAGYEITPRTPKRMSSSSIPAPSSKARKKNP